MMKKSSNAAGPMAGYLFQIDRAIYHLATDVTCDAVGIETLDDVVVERQEGILVEQLKNSLGEAGDPFTLRSQNLWRTLEIWCDAVDAGLLDLASTRFILVTTLVAPAGSFAKEINDSRTAESAMSCVAKLRGVSNLSDKVLASANRVLKWSDANLSKLIQGVEFVDGSTMTTDEQLAKTKAGLHVMPDLPGAEVVQTLFGWVKDQAMSSWRAGKPAHITREAFDRQFDRIVQNLRQAKFRARAQSLVEIEPDAIDKNRKSVFVKQIELILDILNDEVITTAIKDYLLSKVELTRLSKEGNITESDLKAFDENLCDRWQRIRTKHMIQAEQVTEKKLGQKIFFETLDHLGILAGTQTEHMYLTSGSYHRLADKKRVGWHPKFESNLEESSGDGNPK